MPVVHVLVELDVRHARICGSCAFGDQKIANLYVVMFKFSPKKPQQLLFSYILYYLCIIKYINESNYLSYVYIIIIIHVFECMIHHTVLC